MKAYQGTRAEREALRRALEGLNARGFSDQQIINLFSEYLDADKIAEHPKATTRNVSRATIQRLRTATDQQLLGMRTGTLSAVYNFLCSCPELPTELFDKRLQVHSSHRYAGLNEAILNHMGAKSGPLNNGSLRSLEGTFHLYRKSWTSIERETFIRSIVTFDWVGDALFYTEQQNYLDTVSGSTVNEHDVGTVLPFSAHVIMLGREQNHDVIKFSGLHRLEPFPNGERRVQHFYGYMMAIEANGPFPGFPIHGVRTEPEEASCQFYERPDDLEPLILERLRKIESWHS